MFIYNVHAPSKTFALSHKDDESFPKLLDRVAEKAGLSRVEAQALRDRKDGAGLVYEYDGGRWALEDEDDLRILLARLPPASTSSATLHLTVPHPHAHFAPQSPPSYAASKHKSSVKSNTSKPKAPVSSHSNGSAALNGDKAQSSKGGDAIPAGAEKTEEQPELAPPVSTKGLNETGGQSSSGVGGGLRVPSGSGGFDSRSVRSTTSRKSKWGNDNAEPLGDTLKRAWHEFHNNSGVRTVIGKVGDVSNVRMLLKPGYKGVYMSRTFATKHKLMPKKYAPGIGGYTGMKAIGSIPITVGTKTASHPVMVNEETHFDVVLGRQWLERMNVKVDPIDQTNLTYMDSGEQIACDIVVLKDAQGNKIHVT